MVISTKLFKSLKDPHTAKMRQLKDRYQELDDLSNVAVEMENEAAYKSLQIEMKEVFFDYLSVLVVDSVYKLVPHVLVIWVISLKWQSVTFPIVNWQVNILGAYLLMYLIYNAGQIIASSIKSKLSKLGFPSSVKSALQNKI